ncbi:DUF72 domain-containing protein [Streptomyces sp. NPDC003077]|uniref:DUF72 domain-containing protein n=1 Tax=Streptomyces sp. NPDC003077 TaxID=3154443 RepID=UPI0033B54902
MARILTGTCSWTDPRLTSSAWYPRTVASDAAARLRHYASRLPLVEVDATYYALPSERNSRLWVQRTPDGFVFDVKTFSLLTGHPTPVSALPRELREAVPRNGRRTTHVRPGGVPDEVADELWGRFVGALQPLHTAGRLGAVQLQFPPWLAPGRAAEKTVAACRARCAGLRVAVEFRHPGWFAPERLARTVDLLDDLDATFTAVDTVQGLPSSLPPVTPVSSAELAVVRFHGRNPAWATGTKEERFRHDYTADELTEWLPRVRLLADRAREVHLLFNNCCADAAARAAERMAGLVGTEEDG